jgi:hypothetical protein
MPRPFGANARGESRGGRDGVDDVVVVEFSGVEAKLVAEFLGGLGFAEDVVVEASAPGLRHALAPS